MKQFAICAAMILLVFDYANAGTWTILDKPGATNTKIHGITNGVIYGQYRDDSSGYGFLYDGVQWTTIEKTGSGAHDTHVTGVSGNKIVGYYYDSHPHGFLYDGTNYTTLDMPGAYLTFVYGIEGDNIFGTYADHDGDGQQHGFIYDGIAWTTFDVPSSIHTEVHDIEGNNIVGYYNNGGFLYNGASWEAFNYPGSFRTTHIMGISGDYIVGTYSNPQSQVSGFLYDGFNWTNIEWPGARSTIVSEIEGDKIVGWYDVDDVDHGFIYTIPEPCTLLLLGLGGVLIRKR